MSANTIKSYFRSIRTELAAAEAIIDGADPKAAAALIGSINNLGMRGDFERILNLCSAISGAEAGITLSAPELRD